MLDIVPSYNLVQCQGNLMNQTWKNDKKTFWLDFDPIHPNLGPQILFAGFTTTSS